MEFLRERLHVRFLIPSLHDFAEMLDYFYPSCILGLLPELDDLGDLALLHVDMIGRSVWIGDHFLGPLPTHQVHYHKARMCSRAVQ